MPTTSTATVAAAAKPLQVSEREPVVPSTRRARPLAASFSQELPRKPRHEGRYEQLGREQLRHPAARVSERHQQADFDAPLPHQGRGRGAHGEERKQQGDGAHRDQQQHQPPGHAGVRFTDPQDSPGLDPFDLALDGALDLFQPVRRGPHLDAIEALDVPRLRGARRRLHPRDGPHPLDHFARDLLQTPDLRPDHQIGSEGRQALAEPTVGPGREAGQSGDGGRGHRDRGEDQRELAEPPAQAGEDEPGDHQAAALLRMSAG